MGFEACRGFNLGIVARLLNREDKPKLQWPLTKQMCGYIPRRNTFSRMPGDRNPVLRRRTALGPPNIDKFKNKPTRGHSRSPRGSGLDRSDMLEVAGDNPNAVLSYERL